jgi:hypothetical protein
MNEELTYFVAIRLFVALLCFDGSRISPPVLRWIPNFEHTKFEFVKVLISYICMLTEEGTSMTRSDASFATRRIHVDG